MPAYFHAQGRFGSSIDLDGAIQFFKRYDETKKYALDMSDALDSGDTVASHSWSAQGASVLASVLAGSTVTATITGTGDAELTLVTTGGQTLKHLFRWTGIDKGESDYV